MPKITQVVRQKRRKNRVSVFVDEEFAFGMEEDTWYTLHLHVGEELSAARRQEIEETIIFSAAKEAAQRILARSMRTAKEILIRLTEKEYPSSVIDETLAWLTRYGFLNDEEYARAYIRTRLRLRPASRRMLKTGLIRKGIPESIADAALEEIPDSHSDQDTATQLACAYVAKNTHVDREKLKRRLAGYLQRRGYSMNVTLTAMHRALEERAT